MRIDLGFACNQSFTPLSPVLSSGALGTFSKYPIHAEGRQPVLDIESLHTLTWQEQIRQRSRELAGRGPRPVLGLCAPAGPELNQLASHFNAPLAFFNQGLKAGIWAQVSAGGTVAKLGRLAENQSLREDHGFPLQNWQPRWKVAERVPMPRAHRGSINCLASSGEDSQRVEITGISALGYSPSIPYFEVRRRGGSLRVLIFHFQPALPRGSPIARYISVWRLTK